MEENKGRRVVKGMNFAKRPDDVKPSAKPKKNKQVKVSQGAGFNLNIKSKDRDKDGKNSHNKKSFDLKISSGQPKSKPNQRQRRVFEDKDNRNNGFAITIQGGKVVKPVEKNENDYFDFYEKKEETVVDFNGKYVCMCCDYIANKLKFKSEDNVFIDKGCFGKKEAICPNCGSKDIELAIEVEFCIECGIRPVYDGYNDEIEDTDLCGWCLMEEKKRTGEFQPYSKTA